MTAVIALRRLHWNDADGGEAFVEVRVGTPAYLSEQEVAECYCPYQIRHRRVAADEASNEKEKAEAGNSLLAEWRLLVEHAAYGVDTVQALYLALALVGSELGTLAGSVHPDSFSLPNFGFPSVP